MNEPKSMGSRGDLYFAEEKNLFHMGKDVTPAMQEKLRITAGSLFSQQIHFHLN